MLYYSAILSIVLMLFKHWSRSIASITCYLIKSNVFIITLTHTLVSKLSFPIRS